MKLGLAALVLGALFISTSASAEGGLQPDLPSDIGLRRVPICPDIKAMIVSFTVTKTGPHTGWAKVTGYYGNVGNVALSAPQGQAYAQLWETWPGEKPVMVKQLNVVNAPANGMPLNNNLTFARQWDAVNGKEAKTPPTYKVVYVHDAAVRDCTPTNDVLERSGSDFNKMF